MFNHTLKWVLRLVTTEKHLFLGSLLISYGETGLIDVYFYIRLGETDWTLKGQREEILIQLSCVWNVWTSER